MKKVLLFVLLLVLLFIVDPVSYANSAEPPSILIIVPHAPQDLEISIDPINARAGRIEKNFESYY